MFQVRRGIDPERRVRNPGDADPHSGLKSAQLFEFFAPFERRFRQGDEFFQGRAAIGVDRRYDAKAGRPPTE